MRRLKREEKKPGGEASWFNIGKVPCCYADDLSSIIGSDRAEEKPQDSESCRLTSTQTLTK